MKICPCCGRQLPATEHYFDPDPDCADGLSLNCWRCRREIGEVPFEKYIPQDVPTVNRAPDPIISRRGKYFAAKLNEIRAALHAAKR